MKELSTEEIAQRKRAIFDSMSPRGRKRIERIGYDKWDPFIEPKDPIDIRRDKTKRTTQQLVREFLSQSAGISSSIWAPASNGGSAPPASSFKTSCTISPQSSSGRSWEAFFLLQRT